MTKKLERIQINVNKLKELLNENKITDVELSRMLGKSDKYIDGYMKRPYKFLKPTAVLIAEKLNTSLENIAIFEEPVKEVNLFEQDNEQLKLNELRRLNDNLEKLNETFKDTCEYLKRNTNTHLNEGRRLLEKIYEAM